jgi:hypothetical protein
MRTRLVVAGLAALALLAGAAASPVGAQQITTLYYQEVEKDGRVYVFNTPERFKAFTESGETGTAITLIGKAEGGRTLVAENETAADLYFFKHDLPGYERATPAPYKPAFDVSWKDGKTTFKTKGAEISLSNRVQVRYARFDASSPSVEDRGTFNVRRAKTAIEGKAGDWKFKLQANWVGAGYLTAASLSTSGDTPSLTTTSRRGPELEDAEIWWARNPMATIWVGQGKVPFGRQEYTSSGKLQFVDRWIGNALYAPGRDQGLRLEGTNASKTFEYSAGIYNGIARNINANDNDEYLYAGRIAWMPFGEYKFEESSHDSPDSPKLVLGLAALDNTTTSSGVDTDVFRLGYELGFKWRGLNFLGEFYDEEAERPGSEFSNDGWYAQVGYLFPNQKLEIAARLANIDREQSFSVSNLGSSIRELDESGIAVSWYLNRHVNKIQADWITLEDEDSGAELDELRVQLQIIF